VFGVKGSKSSPQALAGHISHQHNPDAPGGPSVVRCGVAQAGGGAGAIGRKKIRRGDAEQRGRSSVPEPSVTKIGGASTFHLKSAFAVPPRFRGEISVNQR